MLCYLMDSMFMLTLELLSLVDSVHLSKHGPFIDFFRGIVFKT